MNLKNMDQENNEHSLPMDTEHNWSAPLMNPK